METEKECDYLRCLKIQICNLLVFVMLNDRKSKIAYCA